jgi:hypothetical protein
MTPSAAGRPRFQSIMGEYGGNTILNGSGEYACAPPITNGGYFADSPTDGELNTLSKTELKGKTSSRELECVREHLQRATDLLQSVRILAYSSFCLSHTYQHLNNAFYELRKTGA